MAISKNDFVLQSTLLFYKSELHESRSMFSFAYLHFYVADLNFCAADLNFCIADLNLSVADLNFCVADLNAILPLQQSCSDIM
jgi:hypothetical protein